MMSRRNAIIALVLLALVAVAVVAAVYVTGQSFPTAKQIQVKRIAVLALAALGMLFAVIFARSFVRSTALSTVLILLAVIGLGGSAAFVTKKLSPRTKHAHKGTSQPRGDLLVPASRSRIMVRSEPSGATVFVNGTAFATTPTSLILPNGDYEISVRQDGYADWTETVALSEDRKLSAKLVAR